MLNRFEYVEDPSVLPKPVRDVRATWLAFLIPHRTTAVRVREMGALLTFPSSGVRLRGEAFKAEFDTQLQAEVPELVSATNRLVRSISRLQGWQIDWRSRLKNPTISVNEESDTPSELVMFGLERSDREFPHFSGTLEGWQLGVLDDNGTYGVELSIRELAEESVAAHSLFNICEIALRSPVRYSALNQ
jgi:hypothetical protein